MPVKEISQISQEEWQNISDKIPHRGLAGGNKSRDERINFKEVAQAALKGESQRIVVDGPDKNHEVYVLQNRLRGYGRGKLRAIINPEETTDESTVIYVGLND